MDGLMPVKVMVTLAHYKALYAEAEKSGRTVGEVLLAKACPPKRGGARRGAGRPSGYTTRAGEEISAGRRFNMSWAEISRQLGISDHTARAWLRKYENEVREQNARDRAERKAS